MRLYRRAKLEKFALYLRPDGLLTRLTTYKDLDRERSSCAGRTRGVVVCAIVLCVLKARRWRW